MSITLEILTETNYKTFLNAWDGTEPYSEYEGRWEEATAVYTNFSGNTGRLYDVLYPMSGYADDFSQEAGYTVNIATKAELEQILSKETDEELLDKWEYIMGYLDSVPDTETVYFFTD